MDFTRDSFSFVFEFNNSFVRSSFTLILRHPENFASKVFGLIISKSVADCFTFSMPVGPLYID